MPTVVVTRPQPDAALWVQQLQDAGLQACALPMMVIGPSRSPAAIASLQQTLPQLARYRALMFVSGNAVRYFFAALQAQAITPLCRPSTGRPAPAPARPCFLKEFRHKALSSLRQMLLNLILRHCGRRLATTFRRVTRYSSCAAAMAASPVARAASG